MQQAGGAFDGVSFHCYAGSVQEQSDFSSQFPEKEIYFTECSGTIGSDWWSDIKVCDCVAQLWGKVLMLCFCSGTWTTCKPNVRDFRMCMCSGDFQIHWRCDTQRALRSHVSVLLPRVAENTDMDIKMLGGISRSIQMVPLSSRPPTLAATLPAGASVRIPCL